MLAYLRSLATPREWVEDIAGVMCLFGSLPLILLLAYGLSA